MSLERISEIRKQNTEKVADRKTNRDKMADRNKWWKGEQFADRSESKS